MAPSAVQARKPLPPRGITRGNPGAPVRNPAVTAFTVTAGQPFTRWNSEDAGTSWQTGTPFVQQ